MNMFSRSWKRTNKRKKKSIVKSQHNHIMLWIEYDISSTLIAFNYIHTLERKHIAIYLLLLAEFRLVFVFQKNWFFIFESTITNANTSKFQIPIKLFLHPSWKNDAILQLLTNSVGPTIVHCYFDSNEQNCTYFEQPFNLHIN